MHQSGKEMSLQRGIARLMQPGRREAGASPSAAEEMAEFAAEPGIRDIAGRRAAPVIKR